MKKTETREETLARLAKDARFGAATVSKREHDLERGRRRVVDPDADRGPNQRESTIS